MWRVLGEADQAQHQARFAPYVEAKTSGQFVHRLRGSEIGATMERLGQLYAWMCEALEAGYGSREIHRIVRRVFAEQFTRVEDRIAVRAGAEIESDSLQSPDDPTATYRKKDEAFYGFVLHATETADPAEDLHLITDVVVAPNTRSDGGILNERLVEMQRKTPGLRELHTDGTYGSDENDRVQAELGIAAVQTGICGVTPQAPMRIDRDEAGLLHVRCAAGHTVPGQLAQLHYKAVFAAASCAGCPLAAECPSKRLARGRTFYFGEADVLRQARHRRIETLPEERRTLRANVEATMKQFKAPCRNGKLRTRGLCAARQYGFLRAIAINFGRIYRYLNRGLRPSRRPATALGRRVHTAPTALRAMWDALASIRRRFRACVTSNCAIRTVHASV